MKKVLFVTPTLQPSSAAKQLTLLVPGLPAGGFAAQVCVLGGSGAFARTLHEAGLPVQILDGTRRLDLRPFLRFRKLLAEFDPDIIHVWSPRALALCIAAGARRGGKPARHIVVSNPMPRGGRKTRVSRLMSWLLGRADQIVAGGPAEEECCRALGLSPARLAVIRPAVALQKPAGTEGTDLRALLGLAPGSPLVVCAGPLEPHKGMYDALWAYDILSYVYPDMNLVIVGTGSQQAFLERITRISRLPRVHFLGTQPDAVELLAQADVVWVPSRTAGGRNVALEAMAAGRPVVASRLSGLAEIVADGRTGFLVPPGDKVALARQTHLLFKQADRRNQLGEAGRARVAEQFPVETLCRNFAGIYEAA